MEGHSLSSQKSDFPLATIFTSRHTKPQLKDYKICTFQYKRVRAHHMNVVCHLQGHMFEFKANSCFHQHKMLVRTCAYQIKLEVSCLENTDIHSVSLCKKYKNAPSAMHVVTTRKTKTYYFAITTAIKTKMQSTHHMHVLCEPQKNLSLGVNLNSAVSR